MTVPAYRDRAARVCSGFGDLAIEALLVTHPPNLRYLAGFDGSAGALLLASSGATLIVDGRYITSARDRARALPELSYVTVRLADSGIEEAVASALGETLRGARVGVEAGAMTLDAFRRVTSALGGEAPAVELVPTDRAVERVRLIKDALEIEAMRTAARMLSDAAAEALTLIRPGRTERDIAVEVDGVLRRVGFARPAFDTIVASGPNSALPHARPGTRRLEPGDGVVLDFGGIYDGYCVDLTRTVQLAPSTAAFSRLFSAVAEAQRAAIAVVGPNVRASVIDAAARDVLVGHGLGDAFMHGTGHGLGLEVHEEPRVSRAGTARHDEILQPGMVFTIEPGAYLAGLGGVRIEDDVLVTETGCEVLTAVPIEQGGYGAAAAGRDASRRRPAGE